MAIEKYGVEDRQDLIRKELEEVREKLRTKTASSEEAEYLVQREKDLVEALESTEQSLS
jgi:hypothetical protein